MRTARRLVLALFVPAIAAAAAGCGGGRFVATDSLAKLPADEDSAAFLDRMSSQRTVNENDAARGLLMLLDNKDDAPSFQKRIEKLRGRDVVSAHWDYDPDRALTKGKLAYMVYQAAKIPGGVVLMLTGPNRRYCLRELQYRNMMVEGAEFSPVTGLEFVSVLTRADTYIRTGQIPRRYGIRGRH